MTRDLIDPGHPAAMDHSLTAVSVGILHGSMRTKRVVGPGSHSRSRTRALATRIAASADAIGPVHARRAYAAGVRLREIGGLTRAIDARFLRMASGQRDSSASHDSEHERPSWKGIQTSPRMRLDRSQLVR